VLGWGPLSVNESKLIGLLSSSSKVKEYKLAPSEVKLYEVIRGEVVVLIVGPLFLAIFKVNVLNTWDEMNDVLEPVMSTFIVLPSSNVKLDSLMLVAVVNIKLEPVIKWGLVYELDPLLDPPPIKIALMLLGGSLLNVQFIDASDVRVVLL
tara:strand:- start:28 stop:480 length:453 start_codon:yes stop_codon:yes gene_type:complete